MLGEHNPRITLPGRPTDLRGGKDCLDLLGLDNAGQ